jgi:protocatechuate 3,4-dioxygenase beta subunit
MEKKRKALKATSAAILLMAFLSACSGRTGPLPTQTLTQPASATATSAEMTPPATLTASPTESPTSTFTPTLDPYDGPVSLSGHVTDASGKPVKGMFVAFDAFGLGDQGGLVTDAQGYYEKQLPSALQYLVSINPGPAKQFGSFSIPTGYLSERKLVYRNGPALQVDFVMRDGGTLWLRGYDPSGRELTAQEYPDSSLIGAYPLGVDPTGNTVQERDGGHSVYWGWIAGSNNNVPVLLLPPGEPVQLWAVWHLPGTGTTYLHADNDGRGYQVEKAAVTSLNLVYEFARTEYQDVSARLASLQASGYSFESRIAGWLNTASDELSQAVNLYQAGSEAASAVHAYQVLTNVIQAREAMVLQQAGQDIEKNRKGNLQVNLTDSVGNPLTNARVEYQQTSHDFIFSIAWPSPPQYAALRQAGLEYASFESWWGEIEKAEGVYQFPDAEMDQLQKAGFKIVMHASVWSTSAYPPATPGFLVKADPRELTAQAEQYGHDVIEHYGGRIKVYNVFNEPDLSQAYQFTLDELVNMAGASGRGAKQADPNVTNYVNISMPVFASVGKGGPWYTGAYDQFGQPRPGVFSFASPAANGMEFLKALEAAGSLPEDIGLEYYYGVVLPPIDLGIFAGSLDEYTGFSKKLFLSELSYATLDDYPGLDKSWERFGGWHQGYTDAAQADWARDSLTIAFSKAQVSGVQWVGTTDGPADYDFVGDGLFHSDRITPRPALHAINEAIHSWTTEGTATSDPNGTARWRGFGGDYALTITTEDGRVLHGKAHLTEGQDTSVQLVLDDKPPEIHSAGLSSKTARNGESLQITVKPDETATKVSAEVSAVDGTKKDRLELERQADGTYAAEFLVSVLNTIPNGQQAIRVYASDDAGNTGTADLPVELDNPPPSLDAAPPDDDFNGTTLDPGKWNPQLTDAEVRQNGRITCSVKGVPAFSSAMVNSAWQFTGDFDIQIDFQIGAGWAVPGQDHLDGAVLGVMIEGQSYHITRLLSSNQDEFFAWGSAVNLNAVQPTTAVQGKYRLVRVGTNLFYLFNAGAWWQVLASLSVPESPAEVYFGSTSVNAGQAFTTYFDNFKVNSGLTTYTP